MTGARVHGRGVPAHLLGELRDSSGRRSDGPTLREAMERDGYLFLREAIPSELVIAARAEALGRLAEVDEIAPPPVEGVYTGRSRRREMHPDLGAFWKSVSEGAALRRVTHGGELNAILSHLLAEPARAHDFLFLRVGTPGKSTDLHYDMPFFCRGSQRVYTVWIALGEIRLDQGPLIVLDGSTRFSDLVDVVRGIDYDSVRSPRVAAPEDAVSLAQARGTRLLTAHFQAGDAVIFGMTLMHGAMDHHASDFRVRLSCDIRFQPASDPMDPRYAGPDPQGTTGAGYGELNGAKPLTDPWHVR